MNTISKNAVGADNQQETLKFSPSYFYYSGFLAGEMSCCIIRFNNHHPKGCYFMPDITVTNADYHLLCNVNKVLANRDGNISKVKGAFNLSFRGKRKVRKVLSFLETYPILVGNLAKNRIELMRKAVTYLENNRGHKIHQEKIRVMERYRYILRKIKEDNYIVKIFSRPSMKTDVFGYFLSGIIDGEGSIGMKKCKAYTCPFIALAMKDKEIVNLFRDFLGYGKVRLRKDGMYHYETNSKSGTMELTSTFLHQYPLRQWRQRERMKNLQRILNDYTPKSLHSVGEYDIV